MSATALKSTKRRFSSLNHQDFEFFRLVPRSPTHTGLICGKTLEPSISSLGPFNNDSTTEALLNKSGLKPGLGIRIRDIITEYRLEYSPHRLKNSSVCFRITEKKCLGRIQIRFIIKCRIRIWSFFRSWMRFRTKRKRYSTLAQTIHQLLNYTKYPRQKTLNIFETGSAILVLHNV